MIVMAFNTPPPEEGGVEIGLQEQAFQALARRVRVASAAVIFILFSPICFLSTCKYALTQSIPTSRQRLPGLRGSDVKGSKGPDVTPVRAGAIADLSS